MVRDVGVARAIQDALPDAAVPIVALTTFLGASWFVALALAGVYRRYRDDEVVTAAGVLAGSTGGYISLKYLIAVPRPDSRPIDPEAMSSVARSLYEVAVITEGYGFPSGHATTATVAYLLLAEIVPASTRRRRYAAAVGAIALVSFSRMALGAHYLADVAAGVAFGVGFLVAARAALARVPDRRTSAALGLGATLAAVSVIVSEGALDTLLLASVVAPLCLWWALVGRPRHEGAPAPLADRPRVARAILLAAALPPVPIAAAHVGLL